MCRVIAPGLSGDWQGTWGGAVLVDGPDNVAITQDGTRHKL